MKSISGWKIMPAKCKTCPFGPNGDQGIANSVRDRCLSASQICHHPALQGKEETHLCRGSRDEQLTLLHRLGWLSEPPDSCFEQTSKDLGVSNAG